MHRSANAGKKLGKTAMKKALYFTCVLIASVGLGACSTKTDTSALTTNGVAFSDAFNRYLAAVPAVYIDSHTAAIVNDVTEDLAGAPEAERRALLVERETNQTTADRLVVGQITIMRQPVGILKAYFVELAKLAGSDAPEKIGAAASQLAKQACDTISGIKQISCPTDQQVAAAVSSLIGLVRDAAVKKSIEDNREHLAAQFAVAGDALTSISDKISKSNAALNDEILTAKFIDPLVKLEPVSTNFDSYLAVRRLHVYGGLPAPATKASADALAKAQKALICFGQGQTVVHDGQTVQCQTVIEALAALNAALAEAAAYMSIAKQFLQD